MKKIFYILLPLMTAVMTMTSCLKDDDTEIVYSNDVSINAVTLGTMNRTMHTKNSKGEDSTYNVSYEGKAYKMSIDQIGAKIFNKDSLLTETRQKMLMTFSLSSGGAMYIKSLVSDTMFYHQSTDSIDVSQPRILRVVANNGVDYRDYTLEVRIHKENADVGKWQKTAEVEAFKQMKQIGALCVGTKVLVYGSSDNQNTLVYTSECTDGINWTALPATFAAPTSMTTDGNVVYALSDGKIYNSTDAATWSTLGEATQLKKLLAVTTKHIFALATDGSIMASEDGGKTWKAEPLDADVAFVPTEDVTAVVMNQRANEDIQKVILVGNRSAEKYASDATAMVWSRLDGAIAESEQQPWMHQAFESFSRWTAPRQKGLATINYGGELLMLGGSPIGACKDTAFDKIRRSIDQGLTWPAEKRLTIPEGFSCSDNVFAMASDTGKFVWIICGTSGQVWRGYVTNNLWEVK